MVDVAPVHKVMPIAQRLGRGHIDDLEPATLGIGRLAQLAANVLHGAVIGMVGVRLAVQQNLPRRRKGRDNIHMAARAKGFIIARQPLGQPDRLVHPQSARHLRLDPALVGMGVAVGVQLHGFGQQDRALTVHMQPAAFVDQQRGHHRNPRQPGDKGAKPAVMRRAGPFATAPAVKDPIHRRQIARGIMHKGRPSVA